MPTPTNSVFNREFSDTARMSQLVYENESLKIELELLQEQLETSGALDAVRLREDNERLSREAEQLRIRLEEKASKLGLYEKSDERMSHIDGSLKALMAQLEEQREQLTELRDLSREKDYTIEDLKGRLAKHEEATVSQASETLEAERDDAKITGTATGTTLREATARIDFLEQEIERLSLQDKEEAEVRGHAAVAQANLKVESHRLTTERQLSEMRQDRDQLREAVQNLEEGKETLLQRLLKCEVQVQATQEVDFNSPTIKQYVKRQIMEAVADRDRRLREQVDQNASLLARMALLQQESEEMVKKAGHSGRDVENMNERVDFLSKCRNARSTMERRVQNLLTANDFSREDVQVLLQEMLDYQEDVTNETSTLLLIKDLQREEMEKTFRWNMKRLENENASLLKQLQKASYASLHWTSGGEGNSPRDKVHTPPRNTPPGLEKSPQVRQVSSTAQPRNTSTSGTSIVGDLWECTPSRSHARSQHPSRQYSPAQHELHTDPTVGHKAYQHAQAQQTAATFSRPVAVRMVACSACTFFQNLSNGKCEICDAALGA